MMNEIFVRTQMIYGEQGMQTLARSRVAVFGIGGVGGYVAEALARSGVGFLHLIDSDEVALSNLNRQIIATQDSVGRAKVEVMKERILSINPQASVTATKCFFLPENADEFDFSAYDYIVDAVDTVTAKLAIIQKAKEANTPVISCMGTGNKIRPALFEVADIFQTTVCPLARVMRRELKKRGIDELKVVYSKEEPRKPLKYTPSLDTQGEAIPLDCARGDKDVRGDKDARDDKNAWSDKDVRGDKNAWSDKDVAPASTAFCPSVAGLLIASEVINDLTGN